MVTWWSSNRLRLIQNNLREWDADLDVELLIRELKRLEANVLMMNAGGIFAFYPTKLRYHYITPYLKKDLLKETIEAAHANGIRFIARFDFSKAHESIFREKPEWFYRNASGQEVNYYGIVHTCLNGYYQQKVSLDILEEVIRNYEIDGVFFNMFGYQHWDYSGNHYGICHCSNCRERFLEMYGMELPQGEDRTSEVYVTYRKFQEETSIDMLDNMHRHIKSLNSDIAISTYHPHKVDIVRHESNTSLSRPLPKWLYSPATNILPITGSYEGKLSSNCSINAIDLTYRFTGVSAYETEARLYGNLLNGSGLDFCIIGAFEGYPDRANLDSVRKVYRYHRKHEALFGPIESITDCVLVKPSSLGGDAASEYQGVFKMLKEAHILFDVVTQDRLPQIRNNRARLVLLPGVEQLTEEELRALREWQNGGKHVIATGCALAGQSEALQILFRAQCAQVLKETTAAYVEVDRKEWFSSLTDRDWVIVDGLFAKMNYEDEGVMKALPLIAPASFGPPERAYGHEKTEFYAVGISGNPASTVCGCGAYVAWGVGKFYFKHGFADHKEIVVGVIEQLLGERINVVTDAHASVEMSLHRLPDGSLLLQLMNLSGFNGMTYHAPVEMRNIRVEIRADVNLNTVRRLCQANEQCSVEDVLCVAQGDRIEFKVDSLHTYEAYHLNG